MKMKQVLLNLALAAAMLVMLAGAAWCETSFVVSDWDTGNPYFSAELSVDAELAPNGRVGVLLLPEDIANYEITGYAITETGTQPAAWEEYVPVDYEFAALPPQGVITLYAWVKYSDTAGIEDDIIEQLSDWIVYSSQEPIIDVDEGSTAATAFTITVQWETPGVAAVGWLEYRVKDTGDYVMTSPTEYAEWHTIEITGLLDETEYDIIIHANGSSLYYPMTTTAAPPVDGDLVWCGGGPDNNWSTGRNWVGGYPPKNPTTGVLTFPTDGDNSTVDAGGGTWTVGGIARTATDIPSGTHTMNLAGNTLQIDNELRVQTYGADIAGLTGTTELLIENGTLDLTTAAVDFPGRSDGWPMRQAILLTIAPNVTLKGQVGSILMADYRAGSVIMDISGVGVETQAGGVLDVTNLELRSMGNPMGIRMSESTGISTLAIARNFRVGSEAASTFGTYGRIGVPGEPEQPWTLPESMSVTVGNRAQGTEGRGLLNIGAPRQYYQTTGDLVLNGGSFDAFVTDFIVGQCHGAGNANINYSGKGFLDLRTAPNFALDAVNVGVGIVTRVNAPNAIGDVYLPAGTAKAENVEVGNTPTGIGHGYLELNETDLEITNQLWLRRNGEIVVNIEGRSCGIDLAAEASLVMSDGDDFNRITLNFNQPAQNPEEIYYGLRWAGSHESTLNGYLVDEKIQANIAPEITGKMLAVITDEQYTYLALVDEAVQPPHVVASDVTMVLLNGTATVTAMQVDDGSTDPGGLELVSFKLSRDGGPLLDELEFSEVGDYTVTLTVENEEGASGSDTATVHVISEETWRALELVWTDADPAGNEWSRPGNWQYAGKELFMPVPNPSTGLFTFNTPDTSVVDTAWSVASIRRYVEKSEQVGTHTIDLDGNTLEVATSVLMRSTSPTSGKRELLFSNGTLRLGTDASAAVISLTSAGVNDTEGNFTHDSVITIGSDVLLDPHNVGTILLNDRRCRSQAVDLRGVQLVPAAQGVLSVKDIAVYSSGTTPYAAVLIDDTTGITAIEIADFFILGGIPVAGLPGEGEASPFAGYARIGDPDYNWNLPPGMSIAVGDAQSGARGQISITSRAQVVNNQNGRLILNGGSFDAHLNKFHVGSGVGYCDLRKADEFSLNALDMRIGATEVDRSNIGDVFLPAGNATAASLRVGDPSTVNGRGKLQLDGTGFEVTDWLSVHKNGEIIVNVGSTSCGLNLPRHVGKNPDNPLFAPVFEENGFIQINFTQPPTGPDRLYGLRWKGDEADTKDVLTALEQDGKLDIQIGQAVLDVDPAATWEIQYDGYYAYVALVAAGPEYSTYTLAVDAPEAAVIGEDTGVQMTLANDEPAGTLSRGSVRIFFDATGPGDVTFSTDGGAFSEVNSGGYPVDAFELTEVYSNTIDWTLNFSSGGQYTITFRCELVDEAGNPIVDGLVAEGTAQVGAYPYCDANRDGNVDLLDLVFVRNRLFQPTGEADNSQADITGDNNVDLDDLIEVRNHLGSATP